MSYYYFMSDLLLIFGVQASCGMSTWRSGSYANTVVFMQRVYMFMAPLTP